MWLLKILNYVNFLFMLRKKAFEILQCQALIFCKCKSLQSSEIPPKFRTFLSCLNV
jgi:hypothetical protein